MPSTTVGYKSAHHPPEPVSTAEPAVSIRCVPCGRVGEAEDGVRVVTLRMSERVSAVRAALAAALKVEAPRVQLFVRGACVESSHPEELAHVSQHETWTLRECCNALRREGDVQLPGAAAPLTLYYVVESPSTHQFGYFCCCYCCACATVLLSFCCRCCCVDKGEFVEEDLSCAAPSSPLESSRGGRRLKKKPRKFRKASARVQSSRINRRRQLHLVQENGGVVQRSLSSFRDGGQRTSPRRSADFFSTASGGRTSTRAFGPSRTDGGGSTDDGDDGLPPRSPTQATHPFQPQDSLLLTGDRGSRVSKAEWSLSATSELVRTSALGSALSHTPQRSVSPLELSFGGVAEECGSSSREESVSTPEAGRL